MKKQITIAVHYISNNNKVLRQGTFEVIPSNFIKDEKMEVIRVARNFIKQIQLEEHYIIEVEKVIYNGNQDITELFTFFYNS